MTPFKLICEQCGLNQREAAEFLKVSPSAVDKMARGVRNTPEGVIAELRELYRRQRRAADEALDLFDEKEAEHIPAALELTVGPNDADSQSRGWPCVGAEAAVAGMIAAAVDATIKISLA